MRKIKKKKSTSQTTTTKQDLFIDSSHVNLKKIDYLENFIYSDELKMKIDNYFTADNTKPMYIGIIGAWGSGKTSVIETALEEIDNEKDIKIFKYDSWKYEDDSFRRSFIQNILKQSGISKNSKDYKQIENSLYEDKSITTNSISERIRQSKQYDSSVSLKQIVISIIISLVFIGWGIFEMCHNKTTFGEIVSILGTLGVFSIFFAETMYSKSKIFSSEQFYEYFIKIINKTEGKKNIILIDNLDRCEIEEIKKTINVIKGFYIDETTDKIDKEKLLFIIPLDIDSLNKAYQENMIYFLDKIFDDTIYIKTKNNIDKYDFINRILNEYPAINSLMTDGAKEIIVNSFMNTPREIIKTINDYVTEYELLLSKTKKEFVEEEKNRNFLMKIVILKRRHYDFYCLAYTDYDFFVRQMGIPVEEEMKSHDIANSGVLSYFLSTTSSFIPTNYYKFFQSQEIKSYNQIPETVKKAIMNHDVNIIIKFGEKEKIIDLYINIHEDYNNKSWSINILHKYITLIELFKMKFFSNNELKSILEAWKKVFEDESFKNIIVNNVEMIKYENELIFASKIYKKMEFRLFILECIKSLYKIETDEDRYNKLSKWFQYNDDILLDENYYDLLNNYCEHLLNNDLYSNEDHLTVLYSKNINNIRNDIINQFINKNDNNEIIIKLVDNLNEENKNDDSITNELINWITHKEINNPNAVLKIFDYLTKNNIDISSITITNIAISEENDEKILPIIDYYINNNIYNESLKSMFGMVKKDSTKEIVISKLSTNIPENNEEYINIFIEYYFGMTDSLIKKTIYVIKEIVNKYQNHKEEIIRKIVDKGQLNNYYKSIEQPEEREELIELSISLIINQFDKELENIFLYESSNIRLQQFIDKYNTINDMVSIINRIGKKRMKNKVINKLIDIITEKDNIINEEILEIKELNVEKEQMVTIKNVLLSKENIDKDFVNENIK